MWDRSWKPIWSRNDQYDHRAMDCQVDRNIVLLSRNCIKSHQNSHQKNILEFILRLGCRHYNFTNFHFGPFSTPMCFGCPHGIIFLQSCFKLHQTFPWYIQENHFSLWNFGFGLVSLYLCGGSYWPWCQLVNSSCQEILLKSKFLKFKLVFINVYFCHFSQMRSKFWGQDISLSFQKEWIYIDTTPLYAMVRYSGAALGLALSKTSHLHGESRSWTMKLVSAITGLLIGQAANIAHQIYLKPLQNDLTTFYACEYLLNFFTVSSLISLTNKINAWARSDLRNNHTFFFCQSLIKKQHVDWRGR